MKHRTILAIIGILITGCTATGLSPTNVPTLESKPSPSPDPIPTNTITPTPIVLPPGTEIVFEQSGDKEFTGTTYGQGETAIILANMSAGDETQWSPFVAAVDRQKFTTVTFDYRSLKHATDDIHVVLQKLRELGYQRMICIGASLGVTVCSSIANEPEIAGMVLVAGTIYRGSLSEVTYPKLFVAGAPDIKTAYDLSAEPKALKLFKGSRVHGTGLFFSKDSAEFLTLLLDFVNSI